MLKLNSKLPPFAALKLTALAALQDNFSSEDLKHPQAATARRMRGQRQLLEARSLARQKLPFGEMLRFEQWLMGEIESKARTKSFRARLEILHETPKEVVVLPVHEAAQVVAQILQTNHLEVVEQLREAARVHQLISDERLDEALAALEEHRHKFGATYWSAETQIAVSNAKSNSDEVRKLQRRLGGNQGGLVRFLLSAAATRSESVQLGTRQLAFLIRRIKNSVLGDSQKLHTQYRAAGLVPTSLDDLSIVLAYELLLPPLDAVLATLSLGYTFVAQSHSLDERVDQAFLELLTVYGEPILGIPVPQPSSDRKSSLVCSALSSAIQSAVHGLLSSSDYQLNAGTHGLEGAIAGQLAGDDTAAREWLPYFVASFPYHPWAVQMRPALPLRTMAELSHDLVEQLEPRNQSPVRNVIAREFTSQIGAHPEPTFAALLNEGKEREAGRLAQDARYIRRLNDLPRPVRECLEVILSWSLFHDQQRVEALGVCLRLGLSNPRLVQATPLVPMFEGRSWKHVKDLGDLLALACALQLYHSATGDANAKTSKRFAVTALMQQEGCAEPASLIRTLAQKLGRDSATLDFFITQVLDLPLIELLVDDPRTEAAQQQLIAVLQAGVEIGGPSAAVLSARIGEIERAIGVAQTKGTLDATKVVVGESELFHKALQEYRAPYEHLQRLVKDRPSEEIDLEALLRLRPNDLSTEVSDSQRLLHEILTGVLDLFLRDPSAGLDSVIGRRIRHGTITGALRGTLEQLGMISHRHKVGADYVVPKRLSDELAAYPTKKRTAVSAALAKFSASIDGLCQLLCDEVFQCFQQSSSPRLKPAFAFDTNSRNFASLLRMGLTAAPLEEFLNSCFTVFWIGIHANIERERPNIESYVRKTIKDACTRLKTDLRGLNLPDRLLIDRAQVVLDTLPQRGELVLSWLTVPKADHTAAVFSLCDLVHCTDMIVRNEHSDYTPNVVIDAPSELLPVAEGMLLFDALYIAFDNVAKHSKLPRPTINLVIERTSRGLQVTFISDMASSTFADLEKGKLADIQEEIRLKGAASVARRNKGSGLGKLTSLTSARGGRLELKLDKSAGSLVVEFELQMSASAHDAFSEAGDAP